MMLRLKPRMMSPKIVRICAAMALLAATLTAQVGTPNVPIKRVEINGRVINSVSNEPIGRALVQANDQAALTDAEGRFHFEVQAGIYLRVTASKPGYLNDYGLMRNPRPSQVLAKENN